MRYGPWERAQEQLIRAELNVLVSVQRNELLHQQIHNWNPLGNFLNKHQVCCSVVQCVAVCGSVLQCAAVCCSVL